MPPLRWGGDWSARSGYAAGVSLARDPDVTAIFAANDQMAIGVIAALREAGRRVPDDISVVGFDDLPEAAYLDPPLTSVRQDFAELGRRTMALLERVLAGEEQPTVDLVPTTLVRPRVHRRPARRIGHGQVTTPALTLTDRRVSVHTRVNAHIETVVTGGPRWKQRAAFVVGVDFGTLSGRAVVVAVEDGAEVGHRDPRLPARRPRGRASRRHPARPGLGAPGAGRLRRRAARSPCPTALAAAGVDPAQVIGIGTDFTACTMVPTTADGTPLYELDGLRRRPARLRQALEAPRRAAAGRPDQRARRQARRGLAGAVRRPDLLGVGVRQGPAAPRGGARDLPRPPSTGSRPPTGSSGSSAGPTSATPAPPATRASSRTAPTRPATSSPSSTPPSPTSSRTSWSTATGQLGAVAGRLTEEAAAWTGLPDGIVVAVGNVDAHVTAPAAQATEPGQMVAIMGTSTCHIMNGEVLREVPGMCGVVDGGVTPGLWGYEAGQSGVGDIFNWFVTHGGPGVLRRGGGGPRPVGARAAHREGERARRSASTGWSRSTGTAATARSSSTTSSAASCSA